MTDTLDAIRSQRTDEQNASQRALLTDAALIEIAELLFFAYRDFTADPDAILEKFGFGRAHHRVLHFVYRHPGLRVADLLDILKITKQSLARVLKQLVDEGFIEQREGATDRRERLLFLSDKGSELTEKLMSPQLNRISRALAHISPENEDVIRDFLYTMVGDSDRSRVAALLGVKQPHEKGDDQS